MRVLLRPSEPTDVRARVDDALAAGEVVRDGSELRVGTTAPLDGDALRSAAANAARSLRRTGGTIAWSARDETDVRALVEGTAYGAYDPGLYKRGYDGRPAVDVALDAPAELHALAKRQATVVEHLDRARDLSNRPPNDLTPD